MKISIEEFYKYVSENGVMPDEPPYWWHRIEEAERRGDMFVDIPDEALAEMAGRKRFQEKLAGMFRDMEIDDNGVVR